MGDVEQPPVVNQGQCLPAGEGETEDVSLVQESVVAVEDVFGEQNLRGVAPLRREDSGVLVEQSVSGVPILPVSGWRVEGDFWV